MSDDEHEYEIGDASRAAAKTVSTERESHGDAYENHRQIANLWTGFLDEQLNEAIEPWQAAIMMQQVKQSRMQAGFLKFDHFKDISGYSDVALESALRHPDTDVKMDEYERPVRPSEVPACHNCGSVLGSEWLLANDEAKSRGEDPADCNVCGENPLAPVGESES